MTTSPPATVFEGVRVLDVGHIIAGPFTCAAFADFGADVIKIEPLDGDPLRWQYLKNGAGLYYKMDARNKRSVTLNLKSDKGQELLHRLVAVSDVLVENFRPGVMERLGGSWDVLHEINPRLIMCRVSGFGQYGPYSHRSAYGRIGEAFAGFAHITGEPDGPPMHSSMSLGDTIAANWAAQAVMMALYWRDAQGGGRGQVIDLGLYEGLFRQIEQQIVVYDQLGINQRRNGQQNPGSPHVGSYETRDGRHFSFSAATVRTIHAVLSAMGMADDDRFNTFHAAEEHRDELHAAITEWMGRHDLAEVIQIFDDHDAPGGPVMSAAELYRDPHIAARDMIISVPDKELGELKMQGVIPKMSVTPGSVRHAGQQLGESNREVFGDLLGLSSDEIDALVDEGVI